ncbi:MAG: orotidine 5'-phosphate decarboxylase [Candidatus Buchananbacteria bacterium RIFCSPHIGHO2_02_FULL_56_16]|uniref:Orotidine-5'-phosphate decarboxylase n=1 Tax=Candidatus Buchananbacteria bacterium RIFCSPHIGHO2_02_FULL_56_16 TaxID=1797542 RepID=A0A1G1YIU0_9BACT|nr:MAG: orotidine 5'-phosphate decarboxylase [Candidatus Buchananbacteria bacterium RIFCSPHIGHO2_02_FULL_56_16]
MSFIEDLRSAQERNNSRLCVGLDPDPGKLPGSHVEPIDLQMQDFQVWGKVIVDATAPFACCFKPNLAFWCASGAYDELQTVIAHIHNKGLPVIVDGKRNDIGNTARLYAEEVFGFYDGDAATINPYLGWDGIGPFADYADSSRGVFVLCRTSNKSAPEFQGVSSELTPLYRSVAAKVADWRNMRYLNLGLVVGATFPADLMMVRGLVGWDCPILIPGVGKQGGDVAATLKANGGGLAVINSSSAIIFASSDPANFAQAAADKASETRDLINQYWEG